MIDSVKLCFNPGDKDRTDVIVGIVNGLEGVGKLLNDDRFYLNGSKPCVADFVLFEHIEYALQICNQVWELYPKLEAFYKRMGNNANMKKYLAGPHYAKTAGSWLPPMAKINLNANDKIRLPAKLYYFEVDGRAGGIRALLAHANVKY